MRSHHVLLVASALLVVQCHWTALNPACAQESAVSKEIERTIRQFFTSMSKRDVEGLRAVLDTQLVVVEAGSDPIGTVNAGERSAKVHVIDAAKAKEMIPAQGDRDLDKLRISDVKAKTSITHPSLAIASFTMTFPLDAKQIAAMKQGTEGNPEVTDALREAVAKAIKDRAVHKSMFAMLARQRGKWKIACVTLPN